MSPGLAMALLLAAAPAGENPREKLKAVDEELKQEQMDVERLADQEVSILGAIDESEKARDAAAREAARAEARRSKVAEELAEAQKKERAAESDAELRLRGLPARLRVWQRLSPDREASLLLGASSAQQAFERRRLFRSILGTQLSESQRYLEALKEAKAERTAAASLEGDLRRRGVEARAARAEAEVRQKRHAALLKGVRTERGLHERATSELKQAQGRLAAVVANLPPEKMPTTGFEAARGQLPWPTEGTVEVGFGQISNPLFNTVTLQKGVDIRAPEGAVVHGIHAGRVVHAGWLQGYGNLLIVDHGDGYYSLFAHLASIGKEIDDLVQPGEDLGTVGGTGSLKGPYLYFEIRRHGQALDPAAWLAPRAALAGHP